MLRYLTLLTLILSLTNSATATITRWGGSGGACTIVDDTVLITAAGEYKFYSETGGQPDDIDWIRVSSGVSGTVRLYIVHQNGGVGAANVKEIDLTGADVGRLMALRCSGPIGQDAPIKADVFGNGVNDPGVFVAGGIPTNKVEIGGGIGYVLINGDCDADLDLGDFNESGGEGDENPYHGAIKITGHLHGNLTAGSPNNVTIQGTGEHTGNISFNRTTGTLYSHYYFRHNLKIGDENAADPNAIMRGNIYIRNGTMGCGGGRGGWVCVYGDMYGNIQIGDLRDPEGLPNGELYDNAYTTLYIAKSLYGNVTVGRDLGMKDFFYMAGLIEIGGNFEPAPLTPTTVPVISIGNDIVGDFDNIHDNHDEPAKIHIHGDMKGRITVGGYLDDGRIYVDGDFLNSDPTNYEIDIAEDHVNSSGIAIDYDGCPDADDWQFGAFVRISDEDTIYQNDANHHVYDINCCRGDMNNDLVLDDADRIAHNLARVNIAGYDIAYPGLDASRLWHGDLDGDGILGVDEGGAIPFFGFTGCCLEDVAQYDECRADLIPNGIVELADLNELLSTYGKCDGDPGFKPYADIIYTACVDLADLNALLAVYGRTCDCHASRGEMLMAVGGDGADGAGGGEAAAAFIALDVVGVDTNGYAEPGFAGELTHFVFDLRAVVADTGDAWTTGGLIATTYNGAAFRPAAAPNDIEEYKTCVHLFGQDIGDSDNDAATNGARLAGAYLPGAAEYVFDATELNIAWLDAAPANDAETDGSPAAIARLVLDVSALVGDGNDDSQGGNGSDGANDSDGGNGSDGGSSSDANRVYFTTTGPLNAGDVKVADLSAAAATQAGGPAVGTLIGEFYLTTH